jgi:hypothetical protein
MKPDRSNYEIWIIDWLDGNLSAERERLLMEFLAANEDIREEADSLMMARIIKDEGPAKQWENLKKSPADFTASQIEFLSAGYLENDLSPEQKEDLMISIGSNPGNKAIFDSVQKTRLIPPHVEFRPKSRLKRVTLTGRIIRFSAISASAAAAILLLFLSHFFTPEPKPELLLQAAAMVPDTIYIGQPIKFTVAAATPTIIVISSVAHAETPHDSITVILREQGPSPLMIASIPEIETPRDRIPMLLAMSQIYYSQPAANTEEDDRSAIGKFIARTLRSRILKEKQVTDKPIQTYELAEAGIDGLNKLLGWQMALEKTSDSTGNVKSLYFSSRMLKFNAPVKKAIELQ